MPSASVQTFVDHGARISRNPSRECVTPVVADFPAEPAVAKYKNRRFAVVNEQHTGDDASSKRFPGSDFRSNRLRVFGDSAVFFPDGILPPFSETRSSAENRKRFVCNSVFTRRYTRGLLTVANFV